MLNFPRGDTAGWEDENAGSNGLADSLARNTRQHNSILESSFENFYGIAVSRQCRDGEC